MFDFQGNIHTLPPRKIDAIQSSYALIDFCPSDKQTKFQLSFGLKNKSL